MVVWLTGLSGAGKTTTAKAIVEIIKPHLNELVLIDGDEIRDLFGAGLGYDLEARKKQISRIQRLSLFLARQNIPVVVASLYASPELMEWNRTNLPEYFEVYVDTPMSIVEERDTKNLYSKARSGEVANVVGIDLPWHIPKNPDMVICPIDKTPEFFAREIIRAVPLLSRVIKNT